MSDLIERDALIKRLTDFSKWCRDERKQGVDFVLDCPLPDMRAVDAVEVCRCKDCKYSKLHDGYLLCDYISATVLSNWFCWNGERKDGADNE